MFLLATTYGSKEQLATLLKVDPEVVTALEAARQVISFVAESQSYPLFGLFQALPGVAGLPLSAILNRFFEAVDAGDAWLDARDIATFFRVPTRMLVWATPLEVLLGHRLYDLMPDREASWLFMQSPEFRLGAVLGAVNDELQHRRAAR
ncbi:hypothetical protein CDL60_19380 [Roseateles noduli]|nr:hypothetical protein CDL60_19380 [Roseateles noduli]